jgi:hypothetical protein
MLSKVSKVTDPQIAQPALFALMGKSKKESVSDHLVAD